MDAVQYLKERERMCNREKQGSFKCDRCPLRVPGAKEIGCVELEKNNPEVAVDTVEQWSELHPIFTNAMKFEQTFGVKLGPNPKKVVASFDGHFFSPIPDDWWEKEYKEPSP